MFIDGIAWACLGIYMVVHHPKSEDVWGIQSFRDMVGTARPRAAPHSIGGSMPSEVTYDEGSACPDAACPGQLHSPEVEGCYCHKVAPCSACADNDLQCTVCQWSPPNPPAEAPLVSILSYLIPSDSADLGDGKCLFSIKRGGSNCTMDFSGRYEGPVTAADVLNHFGDGSFGHKNLSVRNGYFTYTKVTD